MGVRVFCFDRFTAYMSRISLWGFSLQERGRLNVTSGEMTIAGLTRHDSAKYTPEINNVLGRPIRLVVVREWNSPWVRKAMRCF